MKKRFVTILIHIVVWLAFLLIPLVLLPSPEDFGAPPPSGLTKALFFINFLLLLFFFYFNTGLLIPRLLLKKQRGQYLGAIALCGVFVVGLLDFLRDYLITEMPSGHLREINLRFGVFPFVSTFCIVWVVSSGLRLLKEWQKSEQRLKKSEHERLNAELNQLKSQINPHFLFNTLNGIYTMTVLKNEAAPQTIIQLSNLMSYVLGEAGADYVSLKKDIDHLQAFIELNRLRLTEKSPVTFTLEGNIDGLSIAPLLLLPFVENAFKYGVSNSADSPIEISLKIIGKQLQFTCKNQIFRYDVEIPSQHGIGIANTRRRLALMYPNQYNLQVVEAPFTYEVALQLDLSGSRRS